MERAGDAEYGRGSELPLYHTSGKPGGGLQGAGDGMLERRLVFARDHDPEAWLNLQQLGTKVRKKKTYANWEQKSAKSAKKSADYESFFKKRGPFLSPLSKTNISALFGRTCLGPTTHDKLKLTRPRLSERTAV